MSFNEWKINELSDIAHVFDCPHSTPKWTESGIFVIRSYNVRNGKLNFDKVSFTDEDNYLDRIKRAIPEQGDIVLTREAPMGEVCIVPKDLKCCLGQRVVLIKPKKKKIDPHFLLYSLQSPQVRRQILVNEGTGSTVSNLRIPLIESLKISAPENIESQRRIAAILSALDDKIELNRRMNATLEAIAQALFREWFVQGIDREQLPEGWRVINVGQIFEYVIGGDWGKEEQTEEFPEKVAIIRGTDFWELEKGNYSKVPVRFIKTSNYLKRKLKTGDILIEISGGSKDQPTGRTLLITHDILEFLENVVPASFCRLIRFKNKFYSYYFSVFMKDFYEQGGTWEYQLQSTGLSNFQFKLFEEKLEIILPNESYLEEFGKVIEPILFKIAENNKNSYNLIKTRDLLLPKLMGGEIKL